MDTLPRIEQLPNPRQFRDSRKFRPIVRDDLKEGKYYFAEFYDEDSNKRNYEVHHIEKGPFEEYGETHVGAEMVFFWTKEDSPPHWEADEFPEYSEEWVEEYQYYEPVGPLTKPTPATTGKGRRKTQRRRKALRKTRRH